jgi:hypothetical protein
MKTQLICFVIILVLCSSFILSKKSKNEIINKTLKKIKEAKMMEMF